MLHSRALNIWAMLAGAALFFPALGIHLKDVPFQPLDLLVLAGIPIAVMHWAVYSRQILIIALFFLLSLSLSFAMAEGEVIVLAHGVAFILPFLALIYLVSASAPARRAFLLGFMIGGGVSVALFLAQIVFGAQALDFRSHEGFSLPPQYGRGFALFPEVSTFATHTILIFTVSLVAVLHPDGTPTLRRGAVVTLIVTAGALLLTRSTSFLVVAPILAVFAVALTQKINAVGILKIALVGLVIAGLLYFFFTAFYAERVQSASAARSSQMRLASILAGLSPLWNGEVFGIGIGHNDAITRRAYDISQQFDLNFGQLPKGVNSQVVGRIFEEGWFAVVHMGIAALMLWRAIRTRRRDLTTTAFLVLAMGSLLIAGGVTGYRSIYTCWIWLAVPAGLMAYTPVRRSTAPMVFQSI